MVQSSKDALTHAVRSFKREAINQAFLAPASTSHLSLDLPAVQLDQLDLTDKIEVCKIMLELLEVQSMLPEHLQNNLWEMRSLVRKYKSAYFGKGVSHAC